MTLRIHPDEIVRDSSSPLLGIHPTWERVRLSDIADVLNGFAFRSTKFSNSEGVPLLRIRDVGQSQTEAAYVGDFDPLYLVDAGAIVVGMDGDFRVARWAGPTALLNQRVCKISVRDAGLYSAGFLLYALPGYVDAIHAHTSSVTVKHLSSRTVQEIPLPLPPLAEQQRIVAAIEEQFSRVDAADESLRQAHLRLDVLQKRIRSLVVAEGDERLVGELLEEIEAGKSFKCHGRRADLDEWGVIKVSAMTWGSFDENENKAVLSEEQVDPRWEVKPGDLLLSRANTTEYVGASVLVHQCRPRLLLSDKSMRLLVRPGIDKEWFHLALGSIPARSQMSAVATGTSDSMRNISQEKVRAVRLRVPPFEAQIRIVAEVKRQLSIVDAMTTEINQALRRSTALRRSLLEQAFSGKLVPQDRSDESASVLIERITAERPAAPKPSRRKRKTPA